MSKFLSATVRPIVPLIGMALITVGCITGMYTLSLNPAPQPAIYTGMTPPCADLHACSIRPN